MNLEELKAEHAKKPVVTTFIPTHSPDDWEGWEDAYGFSGMESSRGITLPNEEDECEGDICAITRDKTPEDKITKTLEEAGLETQKIMEQWKHPFGDWKGMDKTVVMGPNPKVTYPIHLLPENTQTSSGSGRYTTNLKVEGIEKVDPPTLDKPEPPKKMALEEIGRMGNNKLVVVVDENEKYSYMVKYPDGHLGSLCD